MRVQRLVPWLVIGALLTFGAACNDQAILGGSGGGDPTPDPSATPGPDDMDGDGIPDDQDTDMDGDGIPDDVDNIPCMGFWMEVWNEGVSSASVLLNTEEILSEDWFPNTEVWGGYINPVIGQNVLELGGKLNGSPSDLLLFHIADTVGVVYLHETIIRDNGPPQTATLEFFVDADC